MPLEYYAHLRGEITRVTLFERFPQEAAAAAQRAWKAELGSVDPDEVDRRIRLAVPEHEPWVLCGGPPCQAFSVVGRVRNGGISDTDTRVYLYRQYLRILSVHEPPVFIMENVKGLLSSQLKGSEIFQQMIEDLRHPAGVGKVRTKSGARYRLYPLVRDQVASDPAKAPRDTWEPGEFVVRCEDYGIPQSRHRVILLGVREDVVCASVPALKRHGKPVSAHSVLCGLPRIRSGLSRTEDGQIQWQDALYAIRDLGFMRSRRTGDEQRVRERVLRTLYGMREFSADRGNEFIPYRPSVDYRPDWFIDPALGGVCNHTSRPHMAADLHRYLFVATYARIHGRSPELRDFPVELLPDHRNLEDALDKGYFDDRFRVQVSSRPATTITSHIAKDGHYFIHYDESQCRSLTVREAARLQTFPDNYYFCGQRTHQYRQVGNAVPPLLACQVAGIVATLLLGISESAPQSAIPALASEGATNG
ncbi:MAG TPA: DNA cytosine methyltransferase [Candidatus Paceibacterota bacterium]|nr:DNA cytosine methyltransferase [Candidatus Paceibacterota bacterium]